jgi:hypothetical protein
VNASLLLLQKQLVAYDFTSFPSLKPNLLEAVDKMLANDIARLMALIPQEATDTAVKGLDTGEFLPGFRHFGLIRVFCVIELFSVCTNFCAVPILH